MLHKILYKIKTSTFLKSMKLLSNTNVFLLLIIILISILQGFLPIITLLISKETLNAIQDLNTRAINLVVCGVFVQILNSILAKIYEFYISNLSLKFDNMISISIIKKSSALKISEFENKNTYDLINRAQSQSSQNILIYITNFLDIIKEIITLLGVSIIIISYSKFF